MTFIELTAEDNYAYQAFFTQALLKHRDCFRISPDDEVREAFPTRGTSDSFTLAALTVNNQLAGVVSFQREGATREKLRHKGLLFRMYVSADYGGQGIGKQLMERLIEKVKAGTDIEQITLTVIASNTTAKKLYEKFGFRTFATEKNAIKDNGVYYDEEQMVLFLR